MHKVAGDAIGDPAIECVTRAHRLHDRFSCHHRPGPVLVMIPTEGDYRDYLVIDLKPNTLLHRFYPGGSLKIITGWAPHNLRRHTAPILLIDEADAIRFRPKAIRSF
ncbi:MAG TPA: hypothetical protein VGJ20_05870 [Xanthobacteraceae bacterium]|jgi:hypothetical protein